MSLLKIPTDLFANGFKQELFFLAKVVPVKALNSGSVNHHNRHVSLTVNILNAILGAWLTISNKLLDCLRLPQLSIKVVLSV